MCRECGEIKPLDDFYSNKSNSDGKSPYCKPCEIARKRARRRATSPELKSKMHRRRNLKRNYGITVEQFDEMYERQGGCCAICGTTEPGGRGRFHVDHCHDSGKNRGLLCHHCNTALGLFKDNPELLQAAIEYLEVHNELKLDAA